MSGAEWAAAGVALLGAAALSGVPRVSRGQIESARLLIKVAGGEDKVAPLIVRIAHAARSGPHPAPAG